MSNANLLIIHQGSLGDVVLTFPAMVGLRKRFKRVDMLCQLQLGKLAAKLGLADKWYPLEAAYFATLFSGQLDAKIKDILAGYSAFLVFSFLADLNKSIRPIADRPCFQIPPRPPARDKIHVAEFIIKQLINCGLLEAADSNDGVSTLQGKQSIKTGKPIAGSKIIIHPGSGSIRKRWPIANFLKLADVLKKRGLRPQFVCGPAETELTSELQDQNQEVQDLSELTELVDLLQSAGGYTGNDSGVSQLAAFLGLPCVVIFGPADPIRWKPLGARVEIVRPELDCHPCFEIEPENCAQPECLTDVTLKSVLTAFDRVC